MPAQTKLTLASLGQIDNGTVGIAFQDMVKQLVQDCDDRPGTKKPRTLTINVKMIPRVDQKGNLDGVTVAVEMLTKGPSQMSIPYQMGTKKDGTLYFHPDDRADPDAKHLFDDQKPDGDKNKK